MESRRKDMNLWPVVLLIIIILLLLDSSDEENKKLPLNTEFDNNETKN